MPNFYWSTDMTEDRDTASHLNITLCRRNGSVTVCKVYPTFKDTILQILDDVISRIDILINTRRSNVVYDAVHVGMRWGFDCSEFAGDFSDSTYRIDTITQPNAAVRILREDGDPHEDDHYVYRANGDIHGRDVVTLIVRQVFKHMWDIMSTSSLIMSPTVASKIMERSNDSKGEMMYKVLFVPGEEVYNEIIIPSIANIEFVLDAIEGNFIYFDLHDGRHGDTADVIIGEKKCSYNAHSDITDIQSTWFEIITLCMSAMLNN